MHAKQKILDRIEKLVLEGTTVIGTFHQTAPDLWEGGNTEMFHKWKAGCVNLIDFLGQSAKSWRESFTEPSGYQYDCLQMRGVLQGIHEVVDQEFIGRIEELVWAEAFDDLLGQADYLLGGGYHVAAGVLGRAVLEEHLRRLCDREGCKPAKAKPTIADYYGELHKAGKINALERKHIEAMAGIGNDCAHNKGTATKADVERLLWDVREFLTRHPIS